MVDLGSRLREIRKRRGLTQKQLEELSGILQNTISRIEIGTIKVITTPTLVALARALSVTTDHLLGIDEQEDSDREPADEALVGARDLAGSSVL